MPNATYPMEYVNMFYTKWVMKWNKVDIFGISGWDLEKMIFYHHTLLISSHHP